MPTRHGVNGLFGWMMRGISREESPPKSGILVGHSTEACVAISDKIPNMLYALIGTLVGGVAVIVASSGGAVPGEDAGVAAAEPRRGTRDSAAPSRSA